MGKQNICTEFQVLPRGLVNLRRYKQAIMTPFDCRQTTRLRRPWYSVFETANPLLSKLSHLVCLPVKATGTSFHSITNCLLSADCLDEQFNLFFHSIVSFLFVFSYFPLAAFY